MDPVALLKIPLGWLQLKKDKLRFGVAVAGVCFAVVLILMQLGFQESLFRSSVRYHEQLRYDLALVSPEMAFIAQPRALSQRRLFQTLAVEGVDAVSPVYMSLAVWKNPWTSETRSIFVLGFRPDDDVIDLPEVTAQLATIKERDAVLFDSRARPEYGPVVEKVRAGEPVSAELSNHLMHVKGIFELGTSFGIDGSVITSDANFLRLFPDHEPGLIQLGLVRVDPSADLEAVRSAVRALLPPDVLVLTREEYVAREITYWSRSTPIGYVFGFGVIVGFFVGAIIVYQILFADVSDHLAEYATLKAMGYSNLFLSGVVIQQAVILAVLGYAPAWLISLWLYRTAGEATHLPIEMTAARAAGVFAVSVAMCTVSAVIALRKARSADPADVF